MELNLSRLFNLIRKDFILSKKAIALFGLALFIICGLFMLLMGDEAQGNRGLPPDIGEIVFGILLIICGTLFALTIFKEYRTPGRRIHYLSTPASHFEKFLVKWLYTLPFYFIGTVVIFLLGYTFFSSIFEAMWGLKYVPLSELRLYYYVSEAHMFVLGHAVAFFLATWFNRYPIPKALVASFVAYLLIFLIGGLIFRIVMWEFFDGIFRFNSDYQNRGMSTKVYYGDEDKIISYGYYALIYIGSFVLWVISYFKVKEKEV